MAFSYNREDGQVSLKADGNVATLASEVAYLIHNLYSTMMHNNPLLGAAFKHMVQAAIFAPPYVGGKSAPRGRYGYHV